MIHGAFSDQPWPRKDPRDGPGLFCTVASDDTVHTAHTVSDVLRRRNFFLQSAMLFLKCFAEAVKTPRNATDHAAISEFSEKREKELQSLISTLMEATGGHLFRDLETSMTLNSPGRDTITDNFRLSRIPWYTWHVRRQPRRPWCHPRAKSNLQLCSPQSLHSPRFLGLRTQRPHSMLAGLYFRPQTQAEMPYRRRQLKRQFPLPTSTVGCFDCSGSDGRTTLDFNGRLPHPDP